MKRLLVMAVVVALAATDALGGGPQGDKKKLPGAWDLTGGGLGGKKNHVPEGSGIQFIFSGDKVGRKGGGMDDKEGTYTIDASKKLKQIPLKTKEGEADLVENGIYELQGDTLRLGIPAK